MNPSATVLVRLAVVVGILLTAATVWFALSLPTPSASLRVENDHVVAEGLFGVRKAAVVTAIRSSAGEHPLEPIDLLDEPDVVSSWEELNDFFDRQGRLDQILRGERVELRDAEGSWLPVRLAPRAFKTLHWTFYSQLAGALLVWLAGLVTYAFSDRGAGARAYAISAAGIAIVIWPAAAYTTRPLAIDGTIFRALSAIDHAGGYLFAVGVLTLLASYPTVILRRQWWLWASAPLAFALDHFQLFSKEIVDFYRAMTVYLVGFIVLAPWQWWASRRDPISRAAFRWIFLALLLGMGSFVTTIQVPLVLGLETLAPQAFTLTCYAATYTAISLGVLRLRLFELDRWWFRVWSWLLGGALVILGDVLLLSFFELEARESLFLTLALVGWLYFPVRQYVWARLFRAEPSTDSVDIAAILTARSPHELDQKLELAVRTLFSPLRIEERAEPLDAVRLDRLGTALLLPRPSGGHLACHYRNGGKDLFRSRDVSEANRLLVVVDSVARALRAHVEGQEAERARIRRDLHDDMGASIIRIIHATRDEGVAALAKRTMRDLRNVLLALSPESSSISETLNDLQSELTPIVEARGRMTWRVTGEADWLLSSRQRANLARTLREATTNALRHGGGDIEYLFTLSEAAIVAEIKNPTRGAPHEEGTGLGIPNIAARLEELGGYVDFRQHEGDFHLALHLPRRVPA